MAKANFYISLIIGEVLAWFIIFMGRVLERHIPYAGLLPIILPVICVVCLYIAFLLGKKIPVVYQFARFVLVGSLNTAIDFGVLNLLIFVTGIASGVYYSMFKAASGLCAMVNSFLWNKFWTFGEKDIEKTKEEAPRFLLVTLIGAAINISIASLVVNYIKAPVGIGLKEWANIGAVLATLVGFLWNFLGYKFIAFKR